jgi:hypothetical protein
MSESEALEVVATWEDEFAQLLNAVATGPERFAIANDLVAHRLVQTASDHPECAGYVSAVLELLGRQLRYDAYAAALAQIAAAPQTPGGLYCESLAQRPGNFVFLYDLCWAARDLALEAGTDFGGGAEQAETDAARVRAEVDWQRGRVSGAIEPLLPPPAGIA